MSSRVDAYVLERLRAAPVLRDPFAHCIVDGVLPADFFEDIIDYWPPDSSFVSLSETGRTANAYRERKVILMQQDWLSRLDERTRGFWSMVAAWLMTEAFAHAVAERFADELDAAASPWRMHGVRGDALIVSDRTDYAIGPHTDSPRRVVSLLFYLPEDAAFRRYGTSLYVPRDRQFRCPGGPHHDARHFELVKTVEFVPNRLLAFPKSDRCFHGVERVDLTGIERRLLIYDVQLNQLRQN